MYIEFTDEEKGILESTGFIPSANGRYIHSDPNFDEFYIELVKRTDNTVEAKINFIGGDSETVIFPSFNSFNTLETISIGD